MKVLKEISLFKIINGDALAVEAESLM